MLSPIKPAGVHAGWHAALRSALHQGRLSVAFGLILSIGWGQGWGQVDQAIGLQLDPSIRLTETYTDNVGLQPNGEKRGDFVTEIAPRLRLVSQATRIKANIDYAPSLLLYARGGTAIRNALSGLATGELIEDRLFLEGVGQVYQGSASPLGPRTTDTINTNPNRIETRTFGLNPYLRGRTDAGLTYVLRNNNIWTSTSSGGLANGTARDWLGRIGRPVQGYGWSGEIERRETEFSGQPPLIRQLARVRLYYQPEPTVTVSTSGGYESNRLFLTDQSGPVYGFGVEWRPLARTIASAVWEHRFFGSSYAGALNHRTVSTAWALRASRDLVSFPEETLRLPAGDTAALLDAILSTRGISDPAQRQALVDQTIRQTGLPAFLAAERAFYTQRIFIANRLDASMLWIGVRTTVGFTVFRADRRSPSGSTLFVGNDAFAVADRLETRGANLTIAYRISPELSAALFSSRIITRSEGATEMRSSQDLHRVQLTQALSPTTSVFGGLRLSRFSTDSLDFAGYIERAVYAGVFHRF